MRKVFMVIAYIPNTQESNTIFVDTSEAADKAIETVTDYLKGMSVFNEMHEVKTFVFSVPHEDWMTVLTYSGIIHEGQNINFGPGTIN